MVKKGGIAMRGRYGRGAGQAGGGRGIGGRGGGYGRGMGGGRGGGYGRGMGRGRGGGASGNCVCPNCGFTVPHTPGIPCMEITCPECGTPMVRDFGSGAPPVSPNQRIYNYPPIKKEKITTDKTSEPSKSSQKNIPKIDFNKCRGCGVCIKVCKAGAIRMEAGKAVIDQNKCTGCLECISACPFGAISI